MVRKLYRQPGFYGLAQSTRQAVASLVCHSPDRRLALRGLHKLLWRTTAKLPTLIALWQEQFPNEWVLGLLSQVHLTWDKNLGVKLILITPFSLTLRKRRKAVPNLVGGIEIILGEKPQVVPLTMSLIPTERVQSEVYKISGVHGSNILALHTTVQNVLRTKRQLWAWNKLVSYFVAKPNSPLGQIIPEFIRRTTRSRKRKERTVARGKPPNQTGGF